MERPKAVICIVHGLGEHIGRYGHVAEFFSAHGIATFGFDHQGHGRSEGKRGHAPNLGSLLDGIGHLLAVAGEHYPGNPVFLYGHSLGGHLALNFVLRRKPGIRGLIATGPWIRLPKQPSAMLVGFAAVMSRIFPKLT
ncbi:MAG: alpha/beta fold hydrolase [Bacteroidetes bacterium]|nr:alpha/beta fold hydrolase [Bacteroidota bacterium]